MKKSVLFTYIKILVVICIIGFGIYFVIKFVETEYDKEAYETVKTNMLLIQAKTELIAQKVEIEEDNAEYVGTKIDEKKEEPLIKNLIDNKIIDIESKKSALYCLDNSNLEELGLGDIKTNNYFVVDYKNNDVIYTEGITDEGGNTIYKLSDMN